MEYMKGELQEPYKPFYFTLGNGYFLTNSQMNKQ